MNGTIDLSTQQQNIEKTCLQRFGMCDFNRLDEEWNSQMMTNIISAFADVFSGFNKKTSIYLDKNNISYVYVHVAFFQTYSVSYCYTVHEHR